MEVGLEQLGSGIKGVNGLPMLGGGVRTSRVLHVFRHGCVHTTVLVVAMWLDRSGRNVVWIRKDHGVGCVAICIVPVLQYCSVLPHLWPSLCIYSWSYSPCILSKLTLILFCITASKPFAVFRASHSSRTVTQLVVLSSQPHAPYNLLSHIWSSLGGRLLSLYTCTFPSVDSPMKPMRGMSVLVHFTPLDSRMSWTRRARLSSQTAFRGGCRRS